MEKAFTEGALKDWGWRKAFHVVGQPLPMLDVGKHGVYIFIKERMTAFGGNSGNMWRRSEILNLKVGWSQILEVLECGI